MSFDPSRWQERASAPKDGSPFIALATDAFNRPRKASLARWMTAAELELACPGEVFNDGAFDDDGEEACFDYWMPLCEHQYDTLPADPSDDLCPDGVTACLRCGHIAQKVGS